MKQLIYRLIYAPPINKFLRSVGKIFSPVLPVSLRLAPSGMIHIKHEGKTLKLFTNQSNYLTYLVFWEGYLQWEYTSIFISLVKKINIFFDVGANIGYYSLLAALNNPNCKIISFEPARGPVWYFKKNTEANHFSNIKLEPIALSHTSGTIDFYEVKNKKYPFLKHNLGGASNAGSNTEESDFIKNTVPAITMDEYVINNNIEEVDLIKMDTEGTENLILEHATYVLSKMKPIIICETLFHVIENKLEEILKAYGYEFFNHTERGLMKVDTINRETDNGIRNCFFVHPDKFHLISEFLVK